MKIVPKAAPSVQAVQANHVIKMNTNSTPLGSVAQPEAAPSGQAPTTEAAPVEATQTNQALSPQHLQLARKEKALRKQQLELQAERDAWKAQQAGYISKDALKADAIKALEEAGVSYEQLLQQQLNAPANVDPLQAKIDALEAKLNGYDAKQAERTTAEYQQALKVIEGDVTLLVESDPAFETIKARSATGEVVKLIERIFEAEGTILSVEDAARLVEEKLAEQTFDEVQKLSQLKKIQAKLQPVTPSPEAATAQAGQKPVKTLTNAMGVTRQLSARERAILAFNNQLK